MKQGNLQDAINYARQNPTSDFAQNLGNIVLSGQADAEAQSLGIDLTPIKNNLQTKISNQPPEVQEKTKNNIAGSILKALTAPALRLGQFAGKEIAGIIGGDEAKTRAEQFIQQETTIPGLGRGVTYPGLKPEGEGRGKQLLGEGLESAAMLAPYGKIAGVTGNIIAKPAANILTGALGGYATDVALDLQDNKTTKQILTPGLGTVIGAAIPGLIETGIALKPVKKTLDETLGQVIQGNTKDIAKAKTAFNEIDTKGVKTFSDLSVKFDEKISELSKVVDDELEKDTAKYGFDDFLITQKTKGGTEVKSNFVVRALEDLRELYTKIGDDVSLAEVDDLINRVDTEGITKQEVNNLARQYGEEFSQKAFSKTGEPLTGINAQRFENTRTGIKTTARMSIGGDAAKIADEKLSSIYNTRDLVNKTVENVNKLRQKINERGLLEKLGNKAVKAVDALSGGLVRGAVGGLLPRGVGNKVMNALDLEEALRKNLDVIDNALNAKDDGAIIKALKNLKFPGDIIDEQTNIINKTKDYIKNPKLGLSIEDVSKKSGSISDNLIQEAKKYKSAEEFVKAQGTKSPDYAIGGGSGHTAPFRDDYNAPAFELTKIYPDDVYDNGVQYYGSGYKDLDIEAMSILKKIKGNPDAEVTIYRSVPKGKGIKDFNKGDWITLTKGYAKEHGESNLNGKYDILSKKVKANEIFTDANSLQEFGYDPRSLTKSQLTDIWNKTNKKVTLPKSSDLSTEAKKYKSAEEFVKSRILTNEELTKKGFSKEEISRYREVVDKQLPINKTTFIDKTKGQFNSIREVGGYKIRARMYDNNPWQIVDDSAELGGGADFGKLPAIKEFRTREDLWKYMKENPKSQLEEIWKKANKKN